ncbi:MAG: hypothetical protein V7707_00865 [Motiliproteus sp.]
MNKLFLIVLVVWLGGCMATMPKPKQADLSGKYDGIWSLQLMMKNEYQHKSTGNFHCNVGQRNLPIFIEQGRVGTMQFGGDAGLVDSQGNLFLRQTIGSFNSYYNANPDRDLVVHGRLKSDGGEGYYLQAISGTDSGCKGGFIATKKDVVSSLYSHLNSVAVPTVLSTNDQTLRGELWTLPFGAKTMSWIVFKDSDDQMICSGYWTKATKRAMEGQWYLYCGENQLMKGGWKKQASTWNAVGHDSAGKQVSLSGRLNNKHQKNMPQHLVTNREMAQGTGFELISCKIGSGTAFITSLKSCNLEGGTEMEANNAN